MASLTFPSSPSNGDTYNYDGLTYVYNSTKNKWSVQSTTTITGISADSIGTSLTPSANVTYDLGTSEKSFRDLYLSGSTIHLGSQQISSNSTGVILPAGTLIGSEPGVSNAELQAVLANTNAYVASVSGTQSQYLQVANVSSYGFATESYVDTSVAALVNSAPTTLNTLDELANALGDDANFAATTTTLIGTKASNSFVTSTYLTNATFQSTISDYWPSANVITYVGQNAGGGGSTADFVANGAISKGGPVMIQTDGKVQPIVGSGELISPSFPYGDNVMEDFYSSSGGTAWYNPSLTYDPNDPDVVVIAWDDRTSGNTVKGVVGTRSGTTWTWGNVTQINASLGTSVHAMYSNKVANKVCVLYTNSSSYPATRTLTINKATRSFTVSSETVIQSNANYGAIGSTGVGDGAILTSDDVIVYQFVYNSASLYWAQSVWNASNNTHSNWYNAFTDASGNKYNVGVHALEYWKEPDVGTDGDLVILYWRESYGIYMQLLRVRPGGSGTALVGSPCLSSSSSEYTSYPSFSNDAVNKRAVYCSWTERTSFTNDVLHHGRNTLNADTNVTGWDSSYLTKTNYGTSVRSYNTITISHPTEANTVYVVFQNALSPYDIKVSNNYWYSTTLDRGTPYQLDASLTSSITGTADYNGAGIFSFIVNESVSSDDMMVSLNVGSDTRSSNFNANNIIGVASANTANNATVTVDIRGGISQAFSGLTIASDYYVHSNGTVDTTYNEASLKLGKSISNTSMILTGM